MGEILLHMVATEIELIKTSTTDQLEEGEFLADIFNTLVPLKAIFVGDIDFGADLTGHPAGGNLSDKFVGDKADNDSNRERDGPEKERDAPLGTSQLSDLECSSSNINDHNLSPNHDDVDSDEEPIAGDTLKNVELIVKTTVAVGVRSRAAEQSQMRCKHKNLLVLVENLHPHKSVENQSLHMIIVITQDAWASKVKNKGNNQLVDSLTNNHLPHIDSDQRRRLGIRLPVKNAVCGGVSSQSKRGESVHNQVDPEQLYGGQNRCLFGRSHSGNKCE